MENIPQIIEIALLLLIAFLIGCVIGWLLRAKIFYPRVASSPEPSSVDKVAPPGTKAPKPRLSVVPDQEQTLGRPKTLSAPRAGKKDNLKLIKGVGPKIEQKLNDLGIYHFDQIAAWDSKTIDWVDDYLSFKGRISRDDWVSQARKLAK